MQPTDGDTSGDHRRMRWQLTGLAVVGLLLCLGIAILVSITHVYWVEPQILSRQLNPVVPKRKGGMMATPFLWPGIHQPPTVAAAEAGLADDTEILGVRVADRSRAYVLKAFHDASRLVVNDLLEKTPVTVTYSDRSNHARVFTSKDRETPLEVWLGGWKDGMVLLMERVFYYQESGKALTDAPGVIPYPDLPFERMTWKTWWTAHPDTDVYLGAGR
jgi:hypothetical protein